MEATKDKKESKNPFTKLKEAIDDKEEQLAILGTFIRLGRYGLGRIHNFIKLHLFTRYL